MNIRASHDRPPLILFVESDAATRGRLCDLLLEAGHRVVAAIDADHALVLLHSRSDVSLVVTSVATPGALDGCALARTVDRLWPEIGLVVIGGPTQPAPQGLPPKTRTIAGTSATSHLIAAIEDLLQVSLNSGQPPS